MTDTMPITLVIGASIDPARYAYRAVQMLRRHGHSVIAVGRSEGSIDDVPIVSEIPKGIVIDTVSIYIRPALQHLYYDSILTLHPRRVLFNPDTENPEFEALLTTAGIATERACTLVLLSTGQY
jgi:predicted CoA-binding protein